MTSNAKLTTIAPGPKLRQFVRQFFITESITAYKHLILPDSCALAAFRLNGSSLRERTSDLPPAIVSGLYDVARTLERPASTSVIVVRFTETGLSAFLREPVDSLFGATISMDQVFVPSVITLVQGQLAAAKNDAERVLALERFLIRQLRRESGTDLLIRDMVGQIKSKHGNVRIAELARRSGLSQSALERRFRRIVGTSPRKLASIVRFRHAIQARAQASRLTDLAYVAGYWDQSHFIKDIVRLSGSAPRALFRQQSLC